MAEIEREWRSFPLYIYQHGDETFILPTDRELRASAEVISQIESDIEIAKRDGDNGQVKMLEGRLKYAISSADRLKDCVERLKPEAKKKPYLLGWPTFGEFMKAEDDAKDWIGGIPQINESRLALKILGGKIKLENIVYTEENVGNLPPTEARKLWEEMKAMVNPNTDRLPFLGSSD
jgi:hypothetical protein